MKSICFYFQLHLPMRLKRYRFFQIGKDHYYYDDFMNEEKIRKLAEQTLLPANKTIAEMIRSSNGKFKCAFSISGVTLEQLEQYAPEVIDSFRDLAQSGSVEFLAETYAHSLSSVYDVDEFIFEVKQHSEKIQSLFGKKPIVFRNTELIYSDEIGEVIRKLGYKTMLIEETKHIMGWKSPNFVYGHSYLKDMHLLVRNLKLSEDINLRFSNPGWADFPLTAEKLIGWISSSPAQEKVFNIWMWYDTFGTVQRHETGIFEFLKALPYHAMENRIQFSLPSELTEKSETAGNLNIPYPISWCGHEKDLSLWNGNDLQQEALNKLYSIGERVRMCNDRPIRRDWLMLQSTEHFRYMSHKDAFGSQYESPYDAFINYMNILSDFIERVNSQFPADVDNEELNELLKTIRDQENVISDLQKELKKKQTKSKAS